MKSEKKAEEKRGASSIDRNESFRGIASQDHPSRVRLVSRARSSATIARVFGYVIPPAAPAVLRRTVHTLPSDRVWFASLEERARCWCLEMGTRVSHRARLDDEMDRRVASRPSLSRSPAAALGGGREGHVRAGPVLSGAFAVFLTRRGRSPPPRAARAHRGAAECRRARNRARRRSRRRH